MNCVSVGTPGWIRTTIRTETGRTLRVTTGMPVGILVGAVPGVPKGLRVMRQ